MKITTAPFFPFKELSEWLLPSVSGSVKSSTVAPMAGAIDAFPDLPLPAITAPARIKNIATKREKVYCLFMRRTPFKSFGEPGLTQKISSQPLDVASAETDATTAAHQAFSSRMFALQAQVRESILSSVVKHAPAAHHRT